MRVKRVKVTKAHLSSYWYATKIGQEFHVFEAGNGLGRWGVIHEGTHDSNQPPCYLDDGDFDVLEVFEANVVNKVTISIERKVDADKRYTSPVVVGGF